jgi:hypothetical protein
LFTKEYFNYFFHCNKWNIFSTIISIVGHVNCFGQWDVSFTMEEGKWETLLWLGLISSASFVSMRRILAYVQRRRRDMWCRAKLSKRAYFQLVDLKPSELICCCMMLTLWGYFLHSIIMTAVNWYANHSFGWEMVSCCVGTCLVCISWIKNDVIHIVLSIFLWFGHHVLWYTHSSLFLTFLLSHLN